MFPKRYLILASVFLFGGTVYSQSTTNYVRTWDVKDPAVFTSDLTTTLVGTQRAQMTTQYLDGLGRPLQTVVKQGSLVTSSSTSGDFVVPNEYDEFGREIKKYLPYVATSSDGLLKSASVTSQLSFLQTFYSTQQENTFYERTVYEPSLLNRVVESFAPGGSWGGTFTNQDPTQRKSVKASYWINTLDDAVRIWNVTDVSGDFGSYTSSGIYPAGRLYKNVTEDEAGKQVIEFKDKEGKVILKKVQLLDIVGTTPVKDLGLGKGYDGWLCTYYIYDDLGQLRCVIQPEGVKTLAIPANNWDLSYSSSVLLKEQCFRYEYDGRGRVIRKKVPGTGISSVTGEVYMVYDKRDRLVFTQDANMRTNNRWLATTYDALNRPVMTAMMTYTGSFSQLQSYVNGLDPSVSSTANAQGSVFPTNLVFGFREVGRNLYQASASIEFNDDFITEVNADFLAEIVAGSSSSLSMSINGNIFPPDATYTALTLTYYDDYPTAPTLQKSYTAAYNTKFQAEVGNVGLYAEALPTINSALTKGMVTATKVWLMSDVTDLTKGKWLETASFYNDNGRVVQVQSDNSLGGKEELTSLYNFSGKVLSTYQTHYNPQSSTGVVGIKTNMTYDVLGRVLTVQKQFNDAQTSTTVLQNSYDALGQLKSKTLGASLETVAYDYNVRGWLLGANRDYVKDANSTSKFGFDLGYDKAGVIGTYAPKFNGNIAGTVWKSAGDGEKRKYEFSYDAANRLTAADFKQWVSGTGTAATFDRSANIDFSVLNLAYDDNGNIKTMDQMGWKVTGITTIDQLRYTYRPNSNQLLNVRDFVNDATTPLGDFRTATTHPQNAAKAALTTGSTLAEFGAITDYSYDANGNLVLDNNKGISSIVYNHLNLPASIGVTGKGTINYVYDAAGNKQSKTTTESNATVKVGPTSYTTDITTTTTYIGGFVYESKAYGNAALSSLAYNNQLQFFAHEEGRVRPLQNVQTPFAFDYFLKDHLGNVRMVLTDEVKVDPYETLTFEDPNKAQQNALWENKNGQSINVDAVRTSLNVSGTPTNAMLVRKSTGSIGATKFLKVMAGDRIHTKVDYYYNIANANNVGADPVTSFLTSLTGSFTNTSTAGAPIKSDVNTINTQLQGNQAFKDFINPSPSSSQDGLNYAPKAYLCVLFFDERFKFDQASSRVIKVDYLPGQKVTIDRTFSNSIKAGKNGYAYIYFTNESDELVYFDNFSLSHERGPILEETHYYPFGLAMNGISSKASGSLINKYKFNGIEQNNDFDLNLYDAFFRNLDPQIGRFWQVDPKTTCEEGPYVIMQNNPISKSDWLGDYFHYANSGVEATYQRLRDENNNLMMSYFGELLDVLASGEKGMSKQIDQLTKLINEHATLNSQWNEMKYSAVEFNISDERKPSGSASGETYYDRENTRINIDLKNGNDYKIMAHELRHGYGYLNGEQIGTKYGDDPLYDAVDEYKGSRVEALFNGRETANYIVSGQYTVTTWANVASTLPPKHNYYKLKDKTTELTLNTPAAIFLKYTSDSYLKSYISRNSNNVNLTTRDVMNASNALDAKANPPRSPQYIFGDALKNKK